MGWQMLSILPLGVMMVSDIRSRSVSSWWLLAFTLVLWVACALADGWRVFLSRVIVNSILAAMIGLALWGYSRLRRKKLLAMLGLGDVLFVFAITPCFEMEAYLLFLVASSVLALAVWPVFRKKQAALPGIPFVSVTGLCFVAVLLYRVVISAHGV